MVFAGWSDAKCSLTPATQRPAGFEPDELQPLIHHYTKQPNVRGQHGAAAVEAGIEVDSIAESGLIDFEQLIPIWQLPDK